MRYRFAPRAVVALLLALFATVAACESQPPLEPPSGTALTGEVQLAATAAPIYRANAEGGLPDHYIVKFKDELVPKAAVQSRATEVLNGLPGASARKVWSNFGGFFGYIPPGRLNALRNHPLVEYIEKDEAIYHSSATRPWISTADIFGSGSQSSPEWHLDRIDEANYPLDGSYVYDNSGDGVTIYVIDSGVRDTHDQFGTRASVVHEVQTSWPGNDCLGHGTEVASAAAGKDWGVAQDATIEAVRINDCTPLASKGEAIDGIDWVADNGTTPSVAVFSFSMDDNLVHSISDAVADVISAGIAFVGSAGNDNSSSCNIDYQNELSVLVAGGLQENADTKHASSNHGSCVDVFAPGDNIKMAGKNSDTEVVIKDGTSYAAPMVAGVAAMYLEAYPNDSPSLVHEAVKWGATPTTVVNGDPDRVLFANIPKMQGLTIDGPTSVKSTDNCVWVAEPVGGRQGYTYTWTGVISSSLKTISGSISSSGWLYLDVEDSTGESMQAQIYVTVGSTSGCPE